MKHLILFSLIFTTAFVNTLYATCIVSARTDNNSVLVGDSITLTINLKYNDGEYCKIGDDVNIPKFKIIKKEVKSEKNNGQIIDTYTLVITPLELGEVSIPAINIQTIADGGFADDEAGLSTPEIKITVNGIIKNQEEAKFKDILPPEKVYERTYLLLYILGGLILLAILIYLLVRYLKRRKINTVQEEVKQNVPPPLSPYEEAMLSLRLLEEEKLISKSMFKELYLRLTEILKRFVERFYGFNALEMTTEELSLYLMDHPQPNLDLNEVKNFFNIADLVKFARYNVDTEIAYRDFNAVRNIIEKAAHPISSGTNTNSTDREER